MKLRYHQLLNNYVSAQIPKLKIVGSKDLESMFERFSPSELITESAMTSEELVESFRLSLITEALTEQYSQTFQVGADRHGAQWLTDYILGFWEPDEKGHADPFKKILINFGIDRSKLNREIEDARESVSYRTKHESGLHPIALTTYGMIQECITDYWYRLQTGFFPVTSRTFQVLTKVRGREALHTVQFRDLTSLQLETDPELLDEVLQATITFKMPANHIPPVASLEARTRDWIPRMHGDVGALLGRIVITVRDALADNECLGKIILAYATRSEKMFFTPVPNHVINAVMGRLRWGHGLVGEIVLEQLGLVSSEAKTIKGYGHVLEFRMRQIIKRWISKRMQLEGFMTDSNATLKQTSHPSL